MPGSNRLPLYGYSSQNTPAQNSKASSRLSDADRNYNGISPPNKLAFGPNGERVPAINMILNSEENQDRNRFLAGLASGNIQGDPNDPTLGYNGDLFGELTHDIGGVKIPDQLLPSYQRKQDAPVMNFLRELTRYGE